MSLPLFNDDILFTQRILAVSGFYTGPLNAKWTAAVDTAEVAFDAATADLRTAFGAFDKRSEQNIGTLLPASQRLARQFLKAAEGFAFTVRIISGTRDYAEQDALFKIGRTVQKDRHTVTNAKGGQSNHNFCIAWDVGLFDAGRYLTGANAKERKAYADLATLIKAKVPGLEWGGDWASFPDAPHYQVATGKSLSQVRALFEAGKPFVP
jgi:peptidoglycan L-alanyl-D-glutamate endopeptidase CwlK